MLSCGASRDLARPSQNPPQGDSAHGGHLGVVLPKGGPSPPFGNPFGGLKPTADQNIFKM